MFTENLLSPPVLFFLLGLVAAIVRSDLEFPAPIPKMFSLYLLMAIGFKGGMGLSQGPIGAEGLWVLGGGVLLSVLAPAWTYLLTKPIFGRTDAAALAATYGSISAVTFIAASSVLDREAIPFGGYTVAAMALMESPAIVVGLFLGRGQQATKESKAKILHEAFLNGSVVLLLGALCIGWISTVGGQAAMKPFTKDIFYGALCLFLLDMGLVSGRRISVLRASGIWPLLFGIGLPLLGGVIALGYSMLVGLSVGNTFLLTTLAASASYIAVPAALRAALPAANPSLYVGMALAVTFPFNIAIGLPLYLAAAKRFCGE